MTKCRIRVNGISFPVYSLNTLVIGSGAAGLNAAIRVHEAGVRDVAIVTGRLGEGTSYNAGSDKQTYYKLSLAGSSQDSPWDMARDLFACGSMHGDTAVIEAQNSTEAFFGLVSAGVPFPFDKFGAYVGYKTDNDPRQRATSAGPLTSRLMCEGLARKVRDKGILILEGHTVIKLLTQGQGRRKKVVGAVALEKKSLERRTLGFVLFNAVNIILATGGPGGLYENSVYPEGQTGAHGLGFEAGATANNLTESQFGLASIKVRWNMSGTYQQVVPRYFSTNAEEGDGREFLNDVFPDMGTLATAIFLKGYQWPFDPRKIAGFGSSLIDLLVTRETARGRRVFLDYRHNPSGAGKLAGFSLSALSPEAHGYLERSRALLPRPIDRLRRMNRPAVDFFKSHGIDLGREPLEIAVCAQHNNGGFKVNGWWESDVRHLFPVGEVCGTHGVYRPGGAALNAGQVGGLRAARWIAKRYAAGPPPLREFMSVAARQIEKTHGFAERLVDSRPAKLEFLNEAVADIRRRMSACAAHVRRAEDVKRETPQAWDLVAKLRNELRVRRASLLPRAFSVMDQALTHAVFLEAINEYLGRGGESRGSYLVPKESGELACPGFDESWKFSLTGPDDVVNLKMLEIGLAERGKVKKTWADIRPLPSAESWFETVWHDFLNDRIIREDI
jgi:succinate dehydrogenase/fumarate reductase flavoprotein subunit